MLRPLGYWAIVSVSLVGCQSSQMAMRNPFAFSNPFVHSEQYEPEIASQSSDFKDSLDSAANDFVTNASNIETESKAGAASDSMNLTMTQAELDSGPNDRLRLADEALRAGDHARASNLYREILEADPANVAAHHRLAVIADHTQDFARAERHYMQALALDPENVDLMNDLGYSSLQQGKYEQSARYLNGALQLDPGNSTALANLGVLAAKAGDLEESYSFFVQAGVPPDEARQRIETLQSEHSHSPPMSSNRDSLPTRSASLEGDQFHSPSPDWASTYGIHPNDNPPKTNVMQTGGIRIEPDQTDEPSGIQQANHRQFSSRFDSLNRVATAGGSNLEGVLEPKSYTLERAALNAGPGSLFPMTSPDDYQRANDPQLSRQHSSIPSDIQPTQFSQSQIRSSVSSADPFTRSPSAESRPPVGTLSQNPLIQTPIDYQPAANPNGQNRLPAMGQQFPVTSLAPLSRDSSAYSQFPGTTTSPQLENGLNLPLSPNESSRRYEAKLLIQP